MRYLSSGESHGPCLTAIIEGLPADLTILKSDIDTQLRRRQKGFGRGERMAIEKDRVEILSGLRFNKTIGSPLTLQIKNRDWENWQAVMSPEGEAPADLMPLTRPRPGHADLAGGLKYGYHDLRLVLERSSARETAVRVAVGTAGRIMLEKYKVKIFSHVISIGSVKSNTDIMKLPDLMKEVDLSALHCADSRAEEKMIDVITKAGKDGDTLGGVIEILVTGVPPGLGSHVHYDKKIDGRLAGALASIQAVKGVEIGAGFSAAGLPGSELHDPIITDADQGISRSKNMAGGIEGGITNGQPIVLRVAMKPIPTLKNPLASVDWITGQNAPGATERSDICAVPAAAVVAEAVTAWELAVAFREKFSGDNIDEIDASFNYYMERVNKRLRKGIKE